MIKEGTIRAIGNSAGTTIPKAMLERYHLAEGDRIYLVETEDGVLITPHDPLLLRVMQAGERVSKKYKNALRELAK